MDAFLQLALLCGLGACMVLAVYYGIYYLKGFFRGFRKLRTEVFLAQAARSSKIARFVYQRWTAPSGGVLKARAINQFMAVAESGNLGEVRRLVSGGINVNIRRATGGKTALMKASQNGCVDVVSFLLNKGAEVDATGGRSGKTALIRASEQGHWQIVEILLEARADVNAKSKTGGKTALMGAIEYGNLATALLLIRAGADVHAKNKKGETAEDIGAKNGRADLLELLRNGGADFKKHAGQSEKHPPGPDVDEYYAVLGCTKNDGPEQIRLKYHALMKQYHPDVIQAKGLPAAFVKFANDRCLLIQEAYQHLIRESTR